MMTEQNFEPWRFRIMNHRNKSFVPLCGSKNLDVKRKNTQGQVVLKTLNKNLYF